LKPIANELLSSRAHLLFSFALKLQTIFKNFTNHFWHHYLNNNRLNADNCIFVRADFCLVKIPLEDILFIEGLADYVKIYIRDRKTIVSRMTMKDIMEKLDDREFIRVHRSFILPFRKIEAVRGGTIFIGDKEFPIGRTYADEFYNRYSL
ncbi:MAG: LytR/AlgR family response regulator transcription factor, partial [Bacteroidales bacterium]